MDGSVDRWIDRSIIDGRMVASIDPASEWQLVYLQMHPRVRRYSSIEEKLFCRGEVLLAKRDYFGEETFFWRKGSVGEETHSSIHPLTPVGEVFI